MLGLFDESLAPMKNEVDIGLIDRQFNKKTLYGKNAWFKLPFFYCLTFYLLL
jgi:hypothetical protein